MLNLRTLGKIGFIAGFATIALAGGCLAAPVAVTVPVPETTTTKIEPVPTPAVKEEMKVETKGEEVKTEEIKTEVKAEEPKVETKVEEVKGEEIKVEVKAEEPAKVEEPKGDTTATPPVSADTSKG